MRVAHIITRMIVGGAQENTLLNCLDLNSDFGDEVVLMTGPTDGPEGKLLEHGRAGDLQVEVIPALQRAIQPTQDWRADKQLRLFLQRYRPDVVHTHSAKAGILGRRVAWNLGVPAIIHSVHGAPFYAYQSAVARTFYRWCETYAARRCHHMVCVADAMTDLMVAAKVAPREKFTTVYSGMETRPFVDADKSRIEMRSRLGIADDDIVVGKIARLFELKGHEFIVAAAPKIVAAEPRIRFLFVGDGILRRTYESQIAAAGLTRHFIFAGLVAPQEVPQYIGAMDMLVHTSLREGLARALPQALLAGKPAISYDIDGAREVVLGGRTGMLLPPRDIDGLTQSILQLAANPQMRQEFGLAGQELCLQRFDHHVMTAQIREIYERFLNKTPSK